MLCKSCVHWRKKAPQICFHLGKGHTVGAGPKLAEKKADLEKLFKITVSYDSVKYFHTSQSLFPLSLYSFLSSIKEFIVSRNWLKGWTCMSILLVKQKLSRLFNCLCQSDWLVEWSDKMVCAIQHWCCWAHVCDQIESAALQLRSSVCKKSALNCALECFDCINDSITSPYSSSACVSLYLVFLCLASPEQI